MPRPPHSSDEGAPTSESPVRLPKGGVPDFLGNGPEGLAAIFGGESSGLPLEPGSVIGRYVLLKQIGEGGFGTVWHAEQREPVTRDVALKLIRPDQITPEIVSRFERERQALAMMDHENMAKVFDAGEHDGHLFLVMEYVPGLPITEYVRKHGLSLRQRVELFIPVCRAMHHAHVKLVLHRDLKPANILVGLNNDKPTPKVIDFGIAKALDAEHAMLRADTSALPVTQLGYVIGTPQYMSPEQARGSAGIDATSDIYTLGVILYELLVGEPPVTAADLAQKHDHYATLNLIIEHEPALPSVLWLQASTSRIRSLDSSLGKDPRRISRQMRGDLDWIILHALEKDRSRRYASADAFADDLQGYLDNEPVSVGPPSISYRFRKFYLRHRVATIAAALVFISIVSGAGVAAWQWHEALVAKDLEAGARQRADNARAAEAVARKQAETSQRVAETREKEAQQARALAEEQRHQAEAAREQETRARNASDRARAEAEDLISFMLYDLRDRLEPLNRTPLLATVAERTERYFTAQASTIGDNPEQARNRAAMHQNKGLIELAQGKTDAALVSFSAFLKIAEDRARKSPLSEEAQSDLALAHNRLGMVHQVKGDRADARHQYQQEQDLVVELLKAKPGATAWRLHLATTHEHLGDVSDDSSPQYQQALVMLELLHVEQPQSIEVTRKLATAHEKLGIAIRDSRPEEALTHFAGQLALLESLPAALADDARIRREKALALQNKGAALLTNHQAAGALPVLAAATNASRALAVADPGNQFHQSDLERARELTATCHVELASALLQRGKAEDVNAALQHLISARDLLKEASTQSNTSVEAGAAKLADIERAISAAQKLIR